uniref:Uncharacterized protein n=1 Tax=Arundo donax TaxID=35708 RepID=A0A0A9EXC7_ARUDO
MSSILGIVAETDMNRTFAKGEDFMLPCRESIFILLTTASKAAPRGSLRR